MRAPVILHAISSFDQDILEISAIPVLNSLSRCIAESEHLRREIIVSPDFWSILQRLRPHDSSAPLIFDMLQEIVETVPPAISSDNYEAAVLLANDFASAGSIGASDERKRDSSTRRSRGVKPEKPMYVVFAIDLPWIQLTEYSENESVTRGIQAIDVIYKMTDRTPSLIQQSHLEKSEGTN